MNIMWKIDMKNNVEKELRICKSDTHILDNFINAKNELKNLKDPRSLGQYKHRKLRYV